VAACLALAIVPARMAISAAHLDDAIGALDRGDCRTARTEAKQSLDAVGQRSVPFTVVAYCNLNEGRYKAAVLAMSRARERDPHNWEMYYGLAVTRAAAGMNPRVAARQAARLNPNDDLAAGAPNRFRGNSREAWIVAGRNAPFLPPSPKDP
jgi:Flp pilus assembly protein TadD